MVILCIGDRGFYPSGQEGFLANRMPSLICLETDRGFLRPNNQRMAKVTISDGVDLGGRFRAVCLHLVALAVRPGRKQTRQSQLWLCPWARGQLRSLGRISCFQKGGNIWPPSICTAALHFILREFPTHHQDLEIQTGYQLEEELPLAKWAPQTERDWSDNNNKTNDGDDSFVCKVSETSR